MFDNEAKNYLRRLMENPVLVSQALPFYARSIKRRLYRNLVSHDYYYPDDIKKLTRTLNASEFRFLESANAVILSAKYSNCFTEKPITKAITLANGTLAYEDVPAWDMELNDDEQILSLHRWNWLLTKLTEEPSVHLGLWGTALITDWLSKMKERKQSLPWESYSTGERICNGLIFLNLTGQFCKGHDDILIAIRDMAFYLAKNLEYMSQGSVSNHTLNNARALYFVGEFFKIKSLSELAKSILKTEMLKVINSDGFLREGSSHYQFLITHWFLEVFWLSKTAGDAVFSNSMADMTRGLLSGCWFFLVFNRGQKRWDIPLIGDVTPDFTPDWLMDITWSGPALELSRPDRLPLKPQQKGWATLFPAEDTEYVLCENHGIFDRNSFQYRTVSGWYRLDFGRITLFWHIEPTGSPIFPSHGHCDTGSFVLFLNGEKVLVDPGRLNNVKDEEGLYGMMASAHNQITIDGLDPFVLYHHRARYPDFYREAKLISRYAWNGPGFEFRIRHEGFGRIYDDQVIFERIFEISENKLIIKDIIEGKREHAVETYFHWAPEIDISHNDKSQAFDLQGLDAVQSMTFSMDTGPSQTAPEKVYVRSDWFYPAYGRKVKSKTLVLRQKGKLPIKNNYLLSWKE